MKWVIPANFESLPQLLGFALSNQYKVLLEEMATIRDARQYLSRPSEFHKEYNALVALHKYPFMSKESREVHIATLTPYLSPEALAVLKDPVCL